ncbi:ferric uptake regulator [Gordonia araii NBRC 100433]|uniref:Ferric uptake regulator n=1 Tax=Gordonia araii NBRC 100433 TaxID=1073574 RepID=G7H3T6_9ACTN|nr:Fur family transcriptional regulator [Gordonia araii]NNG98668.1 transcriptional repressor [Gordonia araii NBRC 100433]GAB10511.1 ferric uptake regulator [Gordonia araii NBRC 100433]
MPPPDELTAALRSADLRVTRPRVAVLDAVHQNPHADTDHVLTQVRAELPTVSRQAVYDILAAFTAAGIIRRIQPAGTIARYEARVGDNHHHAVCRVCGEITDIDCATGEAPCLDGPLPDAFTVDEAEVIYWGTCASCSGLADNRLPKEDPAPAQPERIRK